MGNNQNIPKSSYYNLLQKDIKKSLFEIQLSDFNKAYSLKMKRFIEDKQRKEINILTENKVIDWKKYLLEKLKTNRLQNWRYSLYDFIQNELSDDRVYIYENQIFIQQFVLSSFPQFYLKDDERNKDPILFLFSPQELKSYSERSRKYSKKKKKHKKKKNKKEEEFFELNLGDAMEEEIDIQNQDPSDRKIKNKYNSYKIREHIILIQRQLKEKEHPIHIIINKFCEDYSVNINSHLKVLKETKSNLNIEKIKYQVIKDIQTFIEIISVALKLFYAKTINYEFFISERDEFFNLICFILFNENILYQSLFELFELSNEKNTKDLLDKKIILGNLTTKDAGITTKFRLDDETRKMKENIDKNLKENKEIKEEEIDANHKKKNGVINYFERIDDIQRLNTALPETKKHENNNLENNKIINRFTAFTHRGDNIINFINNNNQFNNLFKEDQKERRPTIKTYKEFIDKINSPNTTLIEKFEDDMDENPSQLDIPKLEDLNNDLKIPYGEAIEYIQKINEYHAPLDKLTVIALTSVLINDSIDEFWKETKNISAKFLTIDADQLMSIYLYIVNNMNLSSIYNHLDFIRHFTGESTKNSMFGFYFTVMEGCLSLIKEANTKKDLIENNDNY